MKNLYQNCIETISFTRKQCGFFLGVAVDVFIKQIQEKIIQQQGKVEHKIFTDNLDNFL